MKEVEMTGKKIDDAIKAGLKELGVSLAEVNVEILQQGGLFRKAKVRLTVVEDEQPAKEKAVVKAQKEEKVVNKEPKEVKAAPCEAKQQQKPVQKTESLLSNLRAKSKKRRKAVRQTPRLRKKRLRWTLVPRRLSPWNRSQRPSLSPPRWTKIRLRSPKIILKNCCRL